MEITYANSWTRRLPPKVCIFWETVASNDAQKLLGFAGKSGYAYAFEGEVQKCSTVFPVKVPGAVGENCCELYAMTPLPFVPPVEQVFCALSAASTWKVARMSDPVDASVVAGVTIFESTWRTMG